jgi:hypothetical protein
MYTTKFNHKNIMTEAGRYITIGDPYQVRQRARVLEEHEGVGLTHAPLLTPGVEGHASAALEGEAVRGRRGARELRRGGHSRPLFLCVYVWVYVIFILLGG